MLVPPGLARDLSTLTAGTARSGRRRVVRSSSWLGKATPLCMSLLIFSWTLEWQRLYGLFTGAAILFLAASTTSYGVAMHRQLHAADGPIAGGPAMPGVGSTGVDAPGEGRAPGTGERGRPEVTAP